MTVHGDPNAEPMKAADFLPVYDAEPDGDVQETPDVAVHPMAMPSGMGATVTIPLRGTGAVVPAGVFGMFAATEETPDPA